MPTRREFLFQAAASAMGLGCIRLLSGCENVELDPKVKGSAFDFITKDEDWYWQTGNGNPPSEAESLDISRDNWSLALVGPDGQQFESVDFDDLKSLEDEDRSMTYIKTMRCVYGTQVGTIGEARVSTGIFKGIPLPELFADVDPPTDETNKIRTFGPMGFTSNITVDRATQEGPDPLPPMLAYEMNARPLPRLRGGPVRLVIPEMWGYKNMKWVQKFTFTEDDSPFGEYETELFGESELQEYIDDPGKIELTNFVTTPAKETDVELEGPDVTIQGASVAGGYSIENTEISMDGGPFEPADSLTPDNILASDALTPEMRTALEEAKNFDANDWPPNSVWTIWSKTFEGLDSGSHEITVRSTDSKGRTSSAPDATDGITHYKRAPRISVKFKVK